MTKTGLALLGILSAVAGASGAAAQQTVTLTSSADFQRGNDEGLITTAQGRVTRDRISAGEVTGWSSTTAMSFARRDHTCVAYNGFLYAIGGVDENGGAIESVSFAALSANGSVGAWNATTSLPADRTDHASVVYNGFVYLIGGRDNSTFTADVWVAPLNANGSVGSWSPTSSLPTGRAGLSAVACNGFVYALGGNDGSSISNVAHVAQVNADGSLGGWTATESLPSGRHLFSAVAMNGFLYSIGGMDPDWASLSEVLVAPINANGSLGSWTSTIALPASLGFNFSVAQGGFIYVFGGIDTNVGNSSEVLVGSINENGSVGAWTSTASLPSARFDHSAAAYNGFLYVTGGYDDNSDTLADVLVSAIAADTGDLNQSPERLRGFYSHLIDLQSDVSGKTLVINGQLSPGGVIRLRVLVAPESTGIFGSEAIHDPVPLGTALQISGSARYVWIRLNLDDTATSDAAQATFVSDITLGVPSPPSVGTVNDGNGTDIDAQDSTTTIEANWSGFTTTGGDSIASYEWAIGTAPGLTNLQPWINVGAATTASNPSLSLSYGMKYVSVRAISSAGLSSAVATSDGVQVVTPGSADPGGGNGHDEKTCGLGVTPGGSAGTLALVGLALVAALLRRKSGVA